jgi:pimeloyl-ACP methyl ester carboxylesterase
VGFVVAVSLIVGFLAALVGVLGPFGGARENVITAVVLIAFAMGWALLAALSIAFTHQPQRWAAVPAALLAIAGIGLLAWPGAVTTDWVSWSWPIASLALVLWMAVQACAHMRSRSGAWLLYPVFGLLALTAAAALCESVLESRERDVIAMDGRLVDVGGRRLFLHTSGTGEPTVVLMPGAGGTASSWGWIEPEVARHTRVCAFDRAGRGRSDDSPHPQDGLEMAADLHSLLTRGGIPGPYVLAGHSFGGLLALTYAAQYPQDVAGMVLIDSTHPGMFERLATYPTFYEIYHRVVALYPSLARMGIGRLAYRSNFDSLPPSTMSAARAISWTARQARSERDEYAKAPALMRQASELKTLENRPLIVVTAGRGSQEGWSTLQEELARLSSNSAHTVLPDADHMGLVQTKANGVIVGRAILDVVALVRDSIPVARL